MRTFFVSDSAAFPSMLKEIRAENEDEAFRIYARGMDLRKGAGVHVTEAAIQPGSRCTVVVSTYYQVKHTHMKEVIVSLPLKGASGGREGWYRTVTGLNPSHKGAKRFIGEYLKAGEEHRLQVGSLLISVEPEGSGRNGWHSATLYRVGEDGGIVAETDPRDWRGKFESFSDQVASVLQRQAEAPKENPLAAYSVEELQAEIKRREEEA